MRSEQQPVFVTGATGMIGNGAVRSLLKRGHPVLALTRSEEAAAKMRAIGVEPLMGDLADQDILRRGAERSQAVIHAGFSHDNPHDLKFAAAMEEANLRTFIAANADKGKKLIYTSGAQVYGSQPGNVREDTPMNTPGYYTWRRQLERLVLESGCGIVLRPNMLYGPGDRLALPVMIKAAMKLGASYIPGSGENGMSPIHIDDLGEAYALAFEKAKPGSAYNLGGSNVSMREIAESIGRLIGAPEKTQAVDPRELLSVNLYAEELTDNLQCDTSLARTELSWKPSGSSIFHEIEHGWYRIFLEEQSRTN